LAALKRFDTGIILSGVISLFRFELREEEWEDDVEATGRY
jgi:hypothetical protein